jgi:hypothetical protein
MHALSLTSIPKHTIKTPDPYFFISNILITFPKPHFITYLQSVARLTLQTHESVKTLKSFHTFNYVIHQSLEN